MNKICIAAALALLLCGCVAARPAAERLCYHGTDPAFENDIGYCHALRVGDTLYISGTAPGGPMPDAVRTTYTRLQETLAGAGLSFDDVVVERVYTTDLDTFIRYAGIRKGFYGKNYPAATWVQVQRLYEPSDVLEVELEAKYPDR